MSRDYLIKSILIIFVSLFFLSSFPQTVLADDTYTYTPLKLVTAYYEAIASKNFEEAYELRPYSWKQKHSYESFCDNWSNNITIELLSVETISEDTEDLEVILKIRLHSSDYTPEGKVYKAYYTGEVSVRSDRGVWRIYDIQVSEE